MGIRIFNNLPPYIKEISNNVQKFENCLKWFLHIHSFYSLEEYFQHNLSASWKCFHFSTIIIIMLVKCVICVLFHSLNVWHSYLTSSSVCSYVCDCQFCNYGCPMYLVIQGFVPRLYLITFMYDLESVWFQRLV